MSDQDPDQSGQEGDELAGVEVDDTPEKEKKDYELDKIKIKKSEDSKKSQDPKLLENRARNSKFFE